jgi:ElaB/YqjD/DUF883 family membrane-anchored ribosome-binding protein
MEKTKEELLQEEGELKAKRMKNKAEQASHNLGEKWEDTKAEMKERGDEIADKAEELKEKAKGAFKEATK